MRPEYVKVRIAGGENYLRIKDTLRSRTLHTVCEEARCPNIAECWEKGTATFMVMGGNCSRGCRFCSVTHGGMTQLDEEEPRKVYESIVSMKLNYAVITSVDRDDLPDQGASHFAKVIRYSKQSEALIEVLIPDFQGREELLDLVINEKPAVLAHNIETVRRLTQRVRDPRAGYDQSLSVLRYFKERDEYQITKSSTMLGHGETDGEVMETMHDLRDAGVDILTIGQYLRPSRKQLEVVEYSSAERFRELEEEAYKSGFSYVASGPLVRTSYKAAEAWAQRRMYNGRRT